MSVVAVKVYDDKVVMAADSIICKWDSKKNNPKDFTKINEINGMIIGGCGFAQELSLLWHYADTHTPLAPTIKDILNFFVEFCRWKPNYGEVLKSRMNILLHTEVMHSCVKVFLYMRFMNIMQLELVKTMRMLHCILVIVLLKQ